MRPLFLAVLSAVLATSATASELGGFGWLMKPKGTARVGDDNILGTSFALQGDLGVDDELTIPGGFLRLGDLGGFGVEFMRMEAEGDNVISRNIQFKDLNFTARSRVMSEVNADFLHAYLRLGVPAEGFAIGAEAGGVFADLEAAASASGIGSASADARAGMPYAGGHLSLNISGFVIKGSIRYSKWDIDDFDVEYLDWEVSGRLEVKPFFVGGGYRSLDVDLVESKENLELDLGFSGPVIYAGLVW
jgi:hypothetical protein